MRWSVLMVGVWLCPTAEAAASGAAASGAASLVTDTFTVRDKATIPWVYTVGAEPLLPGAELLLYDPLFHAMRWSKWGDMSPFAEDCTPARYSNPASWGRVTAFARKDGARADDVVLRLERSNCRDRPGTCDSNIYEPAYTQVTLEHGVLTRGDEIVIVVGDTETPDGDLPLDDCGFQLASRAFPEFKWFSSECLDGKDSCVGLNPVVLTINPLPHGAAVQPLVPSQAVVGQPFRLKVSLLDALGNAVSTDPQTLVVSEAETGTARASWTLSEADGGWHDFQIVEESAGVHRYTVTAGTITATSNPVEVFDTAPEHSIYWGDIHVHNGYTWEDSDGFYHDYNQDYGRDISGLDVVCESQKGLGVEMNASGQWAELQDSCTGYTVEGSYLVLLGWEWIDNVAARAQDREALGHQNVYYDSCDGPLGTHDPSVVDGLSGEHGLWAWLDDVRDSTGINYVTLPHAMQWTGYNYDVSYPGTQTLAEIYSGWGDNTLWTPSSTDEELAGGTQDMLRHGLHLGWIASSDNHDGWMGNPFANKNVPGGLAAFLAPSLTRADIFAAMQQRATYATNGGRQIIHFEVTDHDVAVQQGSELVAWAPRAHWQVHATGELRSLVLWGMDIKPDGVQTRLAARVPEGLDVEDREVIDWDGVTPMAIWIEAQQVDGGKAWSSPIWLTADCARLDEGALDPLGRCASPDTDGEVKEPRCGCAQSAARAGWVWVLVAMSLGLRRRRV